MNSNQQAMTEACKHHVHCGVKSISWSAIVAGALIIMGIGFLMSIYSIAIGLSVFPATADGSITLAVGGLIGVIISLFVATFIGGWVAGYLGRPFCLKRNLGVLYGFTTWCLALFITMVLTMHMGHYLSAYLNFISNPATLVATGEQPIAVVAPQLQSHMILNVSANILAVNILVVFILFFISALGACFGGHYGMSVRCRSESGTPCGCCPPKRT